MFSMRHISIAGALASTCLLPSLDAQTPTNHILTAESGMAPDGFFYVDPATGQVTPVTEPNGNFLGGARTVSVDGGDPTGIYTSAGGSFGGAPVWRLEMVGSNYNYSTAVGAALPFFGRLERMHASSHGVLFTLSSVSDGLYTMADITASPTLLAGLTDATDIALLNDKAYVNSFSSGAPSTILEVDLVSGTVRTLGTNYATVRSLGTLGGMLVAGMENGEIHTVDAASGSMTVFMAPGHGSIIAIAEGSTANDAYFATDSGEVYSVLSSLTPVYTSPYTLEDIDVGRDDSQQFYGQGCAGSMGVPVMSATGAPTIGSTYLFEATQIMPNAVTPLLIGFNRTQLSLAPYGFPGCEVLNDAFVTTWTTADASGIASHAMNIPNRPTFVGIHLLGQFFVLENGTATPLAASNGSDGIIR